MNKKIYISLFLAAAMMGFSSCKDEEWQWGRPDDSQTGELNMRELKVDVSEIEKVVKVETSGRSRAASYDVNSFIVKIIDKSTGKSVNQWTYANTPEVATLAPGDYTVQVYSHEVQAAEWEKPYFLGEKDVTIVANAVERLGTVTAKLSNSAVSIVIDDNLKKFCHDDVQIEVIANDEGRLVYGKDETRKGYFKILEGSSTIAVTFTGTVNGYKENIVLPKTDIEAGQHRIYTFKAKTNTNPVPDETGTVNPGEGIGIDVSVSDEDVDGDITLEEDYTVVDPSERPGYENPDQGGKDEPDDPKDPSDPEEEAAKFSPSNGLSVDKINNYNDYGDEKLPCVLTIECPGKFAHIYVDIKSAYLTESFMNSIMLSTHFDLAEPGSYEGGLNDLGFTTGNDVKGQTKVNFDITTLAPMLAIGEGDGISPSEIHEFVITAVDAAGKQSTCTLRFSGN